MILADKIIRLRKKNGWSQEELAEKMQVSRQAVSKWESAASIPDLEKLLMLSSLFGVTTDYLLKDEREDEEFADDTDVAPVKRVTLGQANAYLAMRKTASVQIAGATFLCIIAVIPLLLLGGALELPNSPISENVAAGVGLAMLLVLVAVAVAIFIVCDSRNSPYEFLDKEPFETEYGVTGMVRERQRAFKGTYTRCNIIGTCFCILSPLPLFLGVFWDNEFLAVIMLTVTMALAGIGAVCFIVSGVQWESMLRLLKEGEYDPRNHQRNRIKRTVSGVFWLTATAVYLAWSFWTNAWDITWLVWPVAGVLFAAVMCVCNLLLHRE